MNKFRVGQRVKLNFYGHLWCEASIAALQENEDDNFVLVRLKHRCVQAIYSFKGSSVIEYHGGIDAWKKSNGICTLSNIEPDAYYQWAAEEDIVLSVLMETE